MYNNIMIINNYIIGTGITTLGLVLFDRSFPKNIKGKYYLAHSIINLLIVFLSYNDMISTYINLEESIYKDSNYIPTMLVYGLHFYHIISYFHKLRFDDWLHHILMIVIALPLAGIVKGGTLLNHGLFFLCGLPGMLDYIMLFLVRNNYIDRMVEKEYNKYINLWIRAPGCIAHSVVTIISLQLKKNTLSRFEIFAAIITVFLVYWNGIYFMEQVVTDYKKNEMKKNEMKKIDKENNNKK